MNQDNMHICNHYQRASKSKYILTQKTDRKSLKNREKVNSKDVFAKSLSNNEEK